MSKILVHLQSAPLTVLDWSFHMGGDGAGGRGGGEEGGGGGGGGIGKEMTGGGVVAGFAALKPASKYPFSENDVLPSMLTVILSNISKYLCNWMT